MERSHLIFWFAFALSPLFLLGQQIGPEIRIEKKQIGPEIIVSPAETLRNAQRAADDTMRVAENTAATAKKAAEDADRAFREAVQNAENARKKAVEDAHSTVAKAAYDAARATKKAAQDTLTTARKAADDAATAAIKADLDSASAAKKAADDAANTARKAAADAGRTARKAALDAELARRKALEDIGNSAKKAAYDAAVTAKKAADDFVATARKAAADAQRAAQKANRDLAAATKKAGDDAVRTAVKATRDVQATRDKAYADAAEVGMRALPADLRNGVRHLGEEAKKEILKYPVVASALLAVIKIGNPSIEAEIRSLLTESCDPSGVIAQLSGSPQEKLHQSSKDVGSLTTPPKREGILGWINTGCRAEAVGVPVRDAAHSTDDFWTIDVELKAIVINGVRAPVARQYIRIEVEPVGRAHDFCDHRPITSSDTLQFGGPVLTDTDGPFLEIHPIDDFNLVVFHPPNSTNATAAAHTASKGTAKSK